MLQCVRKYLLCIIQMHLNAKQPKIKNNFKKNVKKRVKIYKKYIKKFKTIKNLKDYKLT